jgi:transcriptional antiterminator RfaH
MLLTAAEISRDQPIDSWFCLRAQPKREHIAAACLRQIAEVEVFCPRSPFSKAYKSRPSVVLEPMFPGYLFARFEYLGFHRRIRQNPGVTGFVQFWDRLALLPDQLISEIRIRTGANELIELNHGLEQDRTSGLSKVHSKAWKLWSLD